MYLKRLPGITITEIKDSNIYNEGNLILSKLKENEIIIILGEEYKPLSSLAFSRALLSFESQNLVFIIGGPNGLAKKVKDIGKWHFCLSSFTFTHELARLLLLEQIYRAQSISQGSPYHRK